MKRSSCLSALVVGLSLTSASVALAAPPPTTTTPAKPKQVAQAQPSDQPSTPAPAPSPTPEESSSTPPAATPAVTIGTTTTPPASDTPAESAPTPEKKPKPRPFAGSSIFVTQSLTTNTVFRGQTQYDNPTTESNLWITPRYALNDAFQLRGRLIVSYEETNSDSTTYRNEPTLSDTTLQLFYRKIPKFAGIQPAVAANVGLPTSKTSRARTLLFNPGATVQLVRGWEHVLGGDLSIIGSVTYSHPVFRSKNPEVVDQRPYDLQCVGGNNCSDLLSGTMNVSDSLSALLLVSQEWGKWNPAIMYLGANSWVYHPTNAINPVDGQPIPAAADRPSSRQTHYVSAWLDYNFNSWITAEVGYWNSVNALNEGGQRSNVIFDRRSGDTRVYLGASIQLDNLVKELQGGSEGDGGIVRAKSQKVPFFTF